MSHNFCFLSQGVTVVLGELLLKVCVLLVYFTLQNMPWQRGVPSQCSHLACCQFRGSLVHMDKTDSFLLLSFYSYQFLIDLMEVFMYDPKHCLGDQCRARCIGYITKLSAFNMEMVAVLIKSNSSVINGSNSDNYITQIWLFVLDLLGYSFTDVIKFVSLPSQKSVGLRFIETF